MWFETLTGFREESPTQVRKNILLDGELMVSTVNQRRMVCGRLEIPTLDELRERVRAVRLPRGKLRLSEVVANVQELHVLTENKNAVFQVASQFNLLEMASPGITPEVGVDIYEDDFTQGPACAIACGAGTIYRNYFVDVEGQEGQTSESQIDCLRDLGAELGNANEVLWYMQNGYVFPSERGLRKTSDRISNADALELERLRGLLRIGCQWKTEVTLSPEPLMVTQSYCSALPVRYSMFDEVLWERFARLVLEAAYEATFCVAILNLVDIGCNKLFLTLLGGGAFGNCETWILDAINGVLSLFADVELDVAIVSHGDTKRSVRELVAEWSS